MKLPSRQAVSSHAKPGFHSVRAGGDKIVGAGQRQRLFQVSRLAAGLARRRFSAIETGRKNGCWPSRTILLPRSGLDPANTRRPRTRTWPDDSGRKPTIVSSSVVLPETLAPMSAKIGEA